jgi:alpha-mannosidase
MKNKNKPADRESLSRRSFIGKAATGSAFVELNPLSGVFAGSSLQESQWPEGAGKYRVHMIGHAHIDPVWLWPWPEGMAVAYSTFRSALDRMSETT